MVNPSPYMVYLQARGSILVASSPEILCRVGHDRKVINRSVCLLCSDTITVCLPAQLVATDYASIAPACRVAYAYCSRLARMCPGCREYKFLHFCRLFCVKVHDHRFEVDHSSVEPHAQVPASRLLTL